MLFENFVGVVYSCMLYTCAVPVAQIHTLQQKLPSGLADYRDLNELNAIPAAGRYLVLSPLNAADGRVYNLHTGPTFLSATLRGNCGIQKRASSSTRVRYVDPVSHCLPLLHLASTLSISRYLI